MSMKHSESGVALIIVFFVMLIIIAVVLSTSVFLYTSIKVVRNISSSVVSFYAADSGIEKLLYYDRRVLVGEGRGVCNMCAVTDPSCPTSGADELNCQCEPPVVNNPTTHPDGCDPDVCSDCTISFTTQFGQEWYTVEATVYPNKDPFDMEIRSSGFFNGIGRAINVSTGGQPAENP